MAERETFQNQRSHLRLVETEVDAPQVINLGVIQENLPPQPENRKVSVTYDTNMGVIAATAVLNTTSGERMRTLYGSDPAKVASGVLRSVYGSEVPPLEVTSSIYGYEGPERTARVYLSDGEHQWESIRKAPVGTEPDHSLTMGAVEDGYRFAYYLYHEK